VIAEPAHHANRSAGRPRSRFFAEARRIAQDMQPDMAAAFLESVERLQDRIDETELRSALASGRIEAIESAMQVGAAMTVADAAAIEAGLRTVTTATGRRGSEILEGVVGVEVRFNSVNPRAAIWARDRAATLVQGVREEVREAIRLITTTGQLEGLTTVQQARAIRQIVGLPAPWAGAPSRLRQEILDGQAGAATRRRLSAVDRSRIRSRIARGTVTEAFADEMAETYQARLISRRARNIAQEQTQAASNRGLLESWQQAQEGEVLPGAARKHWIVTPDDRLEHQDVPGLNPGGRAMDELFVTPEGPTETPPSRPGCRCGMGLTFPGSGGLL